MRSEGLKKAISYLMFLSFITIAFVASKSCLPLIALMLVPAYERIKKE